MGDRTSERYRYEHQYGTWGIDLRCNIDMVIHHIDMGILDIDMGYGLMIWWMTVSIWSSSMSIWDVLSLSHSAYFQRLRQLLIHPLLVFVRQQHHRSVEGPRARTRQTFADIAQRPSTHLTLNPNQ
jgi:hypothetical protein